MDGFSVVLSSCTREYTTSAAGTLTWKKASGDILNLIPSRVSWICCRANKSTVTMVTTAHLHLTTSSPSISSLTGFSEALALKQRKKTLLSKCWPKWNGTSRYYIVLCPDPALSRGKGSGDYRAISWLCRLSSIDFEQTLITCLHDVRPISLVHADAWMTWHYFIGLSNIKTVDSAQPRNRSIVTRPFSSWEGGVWERD